MKPRRISCPIRCLREDDVRRAREHLKGTAFTKLSYLCKLSGNTEEVLLLSQQRIEELSAIFSSLGDPSEYCLERTGGPTMCQSSRN